MIEIGLVLWPCLRYLFYWLILFLFLFYIHFIFLDAKFQRKSGDTSESEEWIPYCAFHLGDYKKAAKVLWYFFLFPIQKTKVIFLNFPLPLNQALWNSCQKTWFKSNLLHMSWTLSFPPWKIQWSWRSCPQKYKWFFWSYLIFSFFFNPLSHFFNIFVAATSPIHNRLLMHLSLKKSEESKMVTFHQKLLDTIEDQVWFSFIFIHFTYFLSFNVVLPFSFLLQPFIIIVVTTKRPSMYISVYY